MLYREQPKIRPRCPECGKEMTLCTARKHPYFLCVGNYHEGEKRHEPILIGIKGENAWFQFEKLVDLETMEIIDNPYFSQEETKERRKK